MLETNRFWTVFFMERKLKRWEAALMVGVLAAILTGGWLGQEQKEVAGQVIRLHVIANSDEYEDQALKLAVRDRVLEVAETLYPADADLEEAQEILTQHLPELARAGREEVIQQGYDYPVSARLTRCWFPTKEYENFALPAGEYTALRVVIGTGEGKNWWCVAFPPLCLGAASENVDAAVSAGQFTREQGDLMTREGERYIIKFKVLELFGQLQHLFAQT